MRVLLVLCLSLLPAAGFAAELKVLTTGAAKQVVSNIVERFSKRLGHQVEIAQDTAGGAKKRMEAGEAADLVVAPPGILDALADEGLVARGTRLDFAKTGIGVGVKEGAAKPDISTVAAFKAALTAAKTIALPDPKAGGTSALYLESLFKKLGIADEIAAKARYQAGGYAADLVVRGEAELVIHQLSEIKPVKGVTIVGPLPNDIQTTTTYSVALATRAASNDVARILLGEFASDEGRAIIREAGMETAWLRRAPVVREGRVRQRGPLPAAPAEILALPVGFPAGKN